MIHIFLTLSIWVVAGWSSAEDSAARAVVVDDFESDVPGSYPAKWRFFTSHDRRFRPLDPYLGENERFYVVAEDGNQFARAYTKGEALRVSMPTRRLAWRLSRHPVLSWRWRAHRLPEGAREDRVNDVGGAVYVSFSKTDWLGRPLSIKYTYSSSLPVGTVVSTGNVKVIVVTNGESVTERWVHVERNVVEDYRRVFGGEPPDEPFTITLWSDSDDTKSEAEVDFDDLTLLAGP